MSLPLVAMATSPHVPASDEEATALAQHWLRELLGELRQLAAEADRELGHPDPLRTVGEVLTSRSFDELIVSTLPQRVSRWLGMDLPHRLHRRYGLPVTTSISNGWGIAGERSTQHRGAAERAGFVQQLARHPGAGPMPPPTSVPTSAQQVR